MCVALKKKGETEAGFLYMQINEIFFWPERFPSGRKDKMQNNIFSYSLEAKRNKWNVSKAKDKIIDRGKIVLRHRQELHWMRVAIYAFFLVFWNVKIPFINSDFSIYVKNVFNRKHSKISSFKEPFQYCIRTYVNLILNPFG